TRFGKSLYAIGGNDQAARVAGINVERNLVLTYVWCGACAALGGILLAGRAGSADPANSGLNYELDAIAAATVGGTSHTGGICRVTGVLCGILILGVINNGLVLIGVNDNFSNIIKGLIIVGAVAMDMRKNARKA
ncbi:ABC transporter permease subunit, partial [Ruminococcus gauvreauii]